MTETITLGQLHLQHHALTTDALARAIWSLIIEPNDGEAGALVSRLGADEALRVLTGELGNPCEVDLTLLRERAMHRLNAGAVERMFRDAVRHGAELVTPEHPHWPTRVNDLSDHAPFALWVRGNSELLTDELTTSMIRV